MGAQPVQDTSLRAAGPRPNVLAMPSPTVSRFVLLLAALLSSGLFVGTWIHNQTAVGADWLERVRECESQHPPAPTPASAEDFLAAQQSVLQCVESAQQRLAWFAVGGVVLTLLAAVALVLAVPAYVVRRRALRPAGPNLAAATRRVDALAEDVGLRRAPTTMVGSSKLRDAFSFGLPRRYAVALPPALAVRSAGPAFEPLVRHELAHVARRDVLIAWSGRALWYVVAALLALPLVIALARADVSLLPSYLWRAALLLLATLLASAGILRSREYDADLSSSGSGIRQKALIDLLKGSARRPATGWRRLLLLHPLAAQRVAVLEDPALLARASAVEAGVAGFLASVTLPLLESVFATVPSLTAWAHVVPAALVGPLMGATVGLALWRLAVVDLATGGAGTQGAARRLASGAFAGFLVGQAASLAATGTEGVTATRSPLVPVVSALAVAGTTFVVAGLGALVADRSAHFSARGYTTVAILLPGTLFALVLWGASTVSTALDVGGWSLTAPVVVTVLAQPAAAAVVAALALSVLVLVALAPGNAPPGWLVPAEPFAVPPQVERPLGLRLVLGSALVAGTTAALVILAYRLTAGPASGSEAQAQRFDAYVWAFAGAGAAAGLALLALQGLRGAGAGLLAAPVGSAIAALGFVLINTAFGGTVTPELLSAVIRPGLPIGVLLLVLGSLIAALPLPDKPARRPLWLLVLVPALVAGAFATAAISARDTLSPLPQPVANAMSVSDYVGQYASTVSAQLSAVDQAAAFIDADARLAPAKRATRIRAELLAPVDALLQEAISVVPADDGLVRAHATLVSGLQTARGTFESFARAYETGDYTDFRQTQVDRAAASQLLGAWLNAVRAYTG